MSVLGRMAIAVTVVGLMAGLVLRAAVGRRRLRPLLTGLVAVPLALHAGYVAVLALVHGASAWMLLAYLVGAAGVGIGAVAVGRRLAERRGLWAASIPLLAAAVYAAVPFGLVSLALRGQGIDVDVVPTASYLAAAVFATALLLPFAPGGPGALTAWSRRLRRRR